MICWCHCEGCGSLGYTYTGTHISLDTLMITCSGPQLALAAHLLQNAFKQNRKVRPAHFCNVNVSVTSMPTDSEQLFSATGHLISILPEWPAFQRKNAASTFEIMPLQVSVASTVFYDVKLPAWLCCWSHHGTVELFTC